MDVKLYIGGHRASFEHFSAALQSNAEYLKSQGVVYSPATRRTRVSIIKAIEQMKSHTDLDEIQEALFTSLGIDKDTKTFIIVDSRLIGSNMKTYNKTFQTPKVRLFYQDVSKLFKGHNLRLYVETKTPTTLAQTTYAEYVLGGNFDTFDTFLESIKINDFRWSTFIDRIQNKGSLIPATIWRYEDYKYIWRDIIGAFCGLTNFQDLEDTPDLQATGINFQGATLLTKYIEEYPDLKAEELAKVNTAFLRQFPNTMDEVPSSYWDAEQVETLMHSYEDDWYYIPRMDNVETIELLN